MKQWPNFFFIGDCLSGNVIPFSFKFTQSKLPSFMHFVLCFRKVAINMFKLDTKEFMKLNYCFDSPKQSHV